MSTETKLKSISTVPKWDGKVESHAMYLAQISALAEYHDCGDALDLTAMIDCPAAWSSVEVVLATVDKPDSKEQNFHVACL